MLQQEGLNRVKTASLYRQHEKNTSEMQFKATTDHLILNTAISHVSLKSMYITQFCIF